MPRISAFRQQGLELNQAKNDIGIKDSKISSLEAEIEALKSQKASDIDALNTAHSTEKGSWSSKESELNVKIESLNETVKKNQELINHLEVKKMALSYEKQEEEYGKDIETWIKRLAISLVVLGISTSLTVFFALGKPWFDRIEIYLVDLIFISAVWFCASQYSFYIKLRNDYANRKTLAQTYQNILLSILESSDVTENDINTKTKNRFMDKATEVFCSPIISDTKEPLLMRHLLKEMIPLLKDLRSSLSKTQI